MFVFQVMLTYWCFIGAENVTGGGTLQGRKTADKKADDTDKNDINLDVTVEFPFLVGLISNGYANGTGVCTGTLVSPIFVLSSAHCPSRLQHGGIKVFRRVKSVTNKVIEYRQTVKIYTHPLYDSAKRVGDLSLIKVKRPFRNVGHFVQLPSDSFAEDVELNCLIIGIGTPRESHGYKVPVRVQYGRNACQIPELNPVLKYVIAYTWADFLCTKTISEQSTPLPCDRGDALVCYGGQQYGVFSYGYNTGAKTAAIEEKTDCGSPAIQGRHLFVNRHSDWLANTIMNAGQAQETVDDRWPENRTTVRPHRHPPPGPAAATKSVITTKQPNKTPRFFVPDNHPYLVYLEGRLDQDEPVCGGSLISPLLVLTTAYCTIRMSEIEVYLLTIALERHTNARHVYVHPEFDLNTLSADISVVVLRTPLKVNRYVSLADYFEPPVGNGTETLACTVVTKKEGRPYRYFSVQVEYGLGACRKSIDSEIQNTINRTWREFVCGVSGYRSTGDTGDPLICDGLQYGITSHWYRTESGVPDPQVRFLVINQYRGWIDDVTTETRWFALGRAFRSRPRALLVLLQLFLLGSG